MKHVTMNWCHIYIIYRFIAEETVSSTNHLPELTDDPTWIIDPIDGTTNFVHSFPFTCISIGLAVKKELEIGIVYNPVLEQLFTAKRGRGAYLNGKLIKSSSIESEFTNICFIYFSNTILYNAIFYIQLIIEIDKPK